METFDRAYLILSENQNKPSILYSGNFGFSIYKNDYLENVTLEYIDSHTTKISGDKCTFTQHSYNPDFFSKNILFEIAKYEVTKGDWVLYEPTFFEKLVGNLAQSKLTEKIYKLRKTEKVVFVIRGVFIHKHYPHVTLKDGMLQYDS